ncbi:hypothetical protein F5880DRAFT_208589 [Lentinula raphanica]|nr:hypothetical protein F5880DRAFT_208589 [Lentinula raphanica]
MIASKVARGFRNSLHRSTKLLSLSPSREKAGPAAGTAGFLSTVGEDNWSDSDYCHINKQDLPIPLDDPFTAASSSLTLAVRTPAPEPSSRFSLTRFKNLSRISVSMRRPKSIRQTGSRLHLPFVVTPLTPAGAYTWPIMPRPLAEEDHRSTFHQEKEIPTRERSSSRESSGPFKSLTRALTRLGHHSSTKAEPTALTENGTIIVRPPVPVRPAPAPPAEEQKLEVVTYQVVDPFLLTASPSPILNENLSMSVRNSFVPPSPSWLSRNVQTAVEESGSEPCAVTSATSTEEITTPASPSPLPIPPRILVSNCSDSPLLSPLEAVDWLEYPKVEDTRQSFISMINAARKEERIDPVYKVSNQSIFNLFDASSLTCSLA